MSHRHSLCFPLAVSLDELLYFRFPNRVEPRLSKGIDCSRSQLRVEGEHSLEALESLGRHLTQVAAFKRLGLRLRGELKANKAWVLVEELLLLRSQFAKDLLDAKQLVNLGLAGEKGVSVGDFAHDAPHSPNIDLFSIVITQEELGRTVPSGGNVVREFSARLAHLSGKAKVTDLQLVVPFHTTWTG